MMKRMLPSLSASVVIVLLVTGFMSFGARNIEVPIPGVEFKPLTLLFYYSLVGMPLALLGTAILSAAFEERLSRLGALSSFLSTVTVGSVSCALTVPWILASGSAPSFALVAIGASSGALGGAAYWMVARRTRTHTSA